MAAYATQQRESSAREYSSAADSLQLALTAANSVRTVSRNRRTRAATDTALPGSSILDQLVDTSWTGWPQ